MCWREGCVAEVPYSSLVTSISLSPKIQFSEVASSAGCVQLQCEAYRNTWSQQRKKRRLLQKLQALKHTQTGMTWFCQYSLTSRLNLLLWNLNTRIPVD